jgi:alpha/beta hydrolase family protein
VRVGDANVHYETWGTSGSPVVLLPGFAETTVAFSTTAPRLAAKGHVVYALDLSSVGYTRGGRPADLADQTRLVHDWAAKLGIEKPIVVGHSMGAAVAGNLGLVYPDSVGGVVFAGGDALNMDFGDGLPQWLATSTWMRSFYRIATRWTWIDQRFLAKSCGSDCTAFDGKAGAELTRKWMRPLTEGRTEEEMTRLIHDPWILHLTAAQIRSIKVPKGIIWGEEDSAEGLRNSRTNLGNPPERIIRGAGHQMMMAAPERFAASVHELSAAMRR